MQRDEDPPNKKLTPFPIMVANGALHCGSGCTLGDICAEWLVVRGTGDRGRLWLAEPFRREDLRRLDRRLSFRLAFGIVFQYFTIAPMRGLSFGQGICAAVKADTLSLTAWQIGMYGFMAVAYFAIFQSALGTRLATDTVEFWFMMQIAMVFGLRHLLPGELVADPQRSEGEDVSPRRLASRSALPARHRRILSLSRRWILY